MTTKVWHGFALLRILVKHWQPFIIGRYRIGLIMTQEVKIPTHPGDRGEYYLLKVSKDGEFFRTVHKRIGEDATGYSYTKIDCHNRRYQDLAYEENLGDVARIYPDTKWVDLVEGSSKWSLVNFVCENYCEVSHG